jgi:hypothetical protein
MTDKKSFFLALGQQVLSFVVGLVVAVFFLGGARVKMQTLGKEMEAWKSEWKERDRHITKMDLEGSVATKNFVIQYEKEQAKTYEHMTKLQEEVNHLDKMELRIDRLEGKLGKDGKPNE